MARKKKGPQFLRFVVPIIDSLRDLGGSGRPAEVVDLIIEKLQIPEEEQNEELSAGGNRLTNQIHWARFYLAKAGYLDSSKRGVWTLTEKGQNSSLTDQDVLKMFEEVREEFAAAKDEESEIKPDKKDVSPGENDLPAVELVDHRTVLMNILKNLSASGFERLCQRLLREAGFQKVVVTGRSGDGGIDGHGVLQINPLVSFRVFFQSKRYAGSVGAPKIRDFRGAMMGRADKGIIITTGTFTTDAKEEAIRDGVPPIELVDGEKLLDMFENLELGLSPKTIYEVDKEFFDEYVI